MDEATQFLIDHAEAILTALADNDHSPTKAYKALLKPLPEIKAVMSDRSFRSMVKLLPVLSNYKETLDKTHKELSATKAFADKMAKTLEDMAQQQKSFMKIKNQLEQIRQLLDNKTEEASRLKRELDTIRHSQSGSIVKQQLDKKSVNIAGWTVRQRPNGFYYLYKTINGKTQCLYLGKHLDSDVAEKKIEAFEEKLDNAEGQPKEPRLF